jgi:hypothetical protein
MVNALTGDVEKMVLVVETLVLIASFVQIGVYQNEFLSSFKTQILYTFLDFSLLDL